MGFNGVDVVEAQKRYLGVISVIQRWLWMNSNIELVLVYCKCKGFDFSLYVWRLDPLTFNAKDAISTEYPEGNFKNP